MKEKIFAIQKEIGRVSKDSTNPFFNSKYFDINALIEHLRPLLEKHNLLLTQPILDNCVYSKIIDIDSNEGVESSLRLPDIQDPQKIGSAITYYRRYTLASLLAIQSEDDDANKASGNVNHNEIGSILDGNKEWLNKDTDAFDKAKAAIESGEYTIKDVRKKYKVSKEVAKMLES